MNISLIQAAPLINNSPTIDSYSSSEVSPSFGSLDEMMSKAASKMSAADAKTDADISKALDGDMTDPINVLALEKAGGEKSVRANLIASLVGKIPKGLEILNK